MLRIRPAACLLLASVLFIWSHPAIAQSDGKTGSVAEEQHYAFAYGLYSDGLFQMAAEQFESFLQKYPSSLKRMDAFFLSVECIFQQQQFDTAARLFSRFVREYPSSRLTDDAYLRLGEAYLRMKQYEKAVDGFKTVLDDFGESDLAGEAAYWTGETYARAGEYENAIKYYTLAFEHYPGNRLRDYALYGIAWAYQTKGEQARALEWYERLQNEFPQSDLVPASKVRMGECHFLKKDYKTAIRVLSDAKSSITRSEERGEAEYLIGEAYFNLGDFDNARHQYESFLNEFPEHRLTREVVYALGWTHLKTKRYAEARNAFDRITDGDDPLANDALFRRGIAEKLAGNRDEALANWRDVVQRAPEGEFADNALYETGLLLYENEKYTEARPYFELISRSHPTSDVRPEALRMLGECLVAESKFEEAEQALTAALALDNASFEVKTNALYQLGWSQLKQKKFAGAASNFGRFAELYPSHPKMAEARFWRAEARYQLGHYAAASEDYDFVAAKTGSAKREEVLYGAAWSLYKLNDFGKASRKFDQLVREFPKTKFLFDARMRLADSYFFAKEYGKAEGEYRLVIRQFPSEQQVDYAHYQLGQTYYRLGKNTDAVQQFTTLIRDLPGSDLADDAQYAIGWIWFQEKDYDEAIAEFEKFLELFPQSDLAPRAMYSIGDARYNQKDYPRAEQAYRRVLRQYPESKYVGDAITGIQYCLVAQGKNEEALSVIDGFIKENPQSPMAELLALKKGDLLYSQQQYSEAIQEYRKFIDRYPKSVHGTAAYYWIGRSFQAQDRLLDAAKFFEQAVTADGSRSMVAQAALEAGDVYARLKSYDKALEMLSKAETVGAGSETAAEVTVRKGSVYEALGDLASALQQYNAVIRNTGNARAADRARIALARLYLKETNYADGHRLAEAVATSRTDNLGAEAQYVIGLLFSAQKDWQNAVKAFLKVRYVFPTHEEWLARSYLGLGTAYEQLREIGKAREAYRAVLKMEAQKDAIVEAQRKLKNLESS